MNRLIIIIYLIVGIVGIAAIVLLLNHKSKPSSPANKSTTQSTTKQLSTTPQATTPQATTPQATTPQATTPQGTTIYYTVPQYTTNQIQIIEAVQAGLIGVYQSKYTPSGKSSQSSQSSQSRQSSQSSQSIQLTDSYLLIDNCSQTIINYFKYFSIDDINTALKNNSLPSVDSMTFEQKFLLLNLLIFSYEYIMSSINLIPASIYKYYLIFKFIVNNNLFTFILNDPDTTYNPNIYFDKNEFNQNNNLIIYCIPSTDNTIYYNKQYTLYNNYTDGNIALYNNLPIYYDIYDKFYESSSYTGTLPDNFLNNLYDLIAYRLTDSTNPPSISIPTFVKRREIGTISPAPSVNIPIFGTLSSNDILGNLLYILDNIDINTFYNFQSVPGITCASNTTSANTTSPNTTSPKSSLQINQFLPAFIDPCGYINGNYKQGYLNTYTHDNYSNFINSYNNSVYSSVKSNVCNQPSSYFKNITQYNIFKTNCS